MHLNAQQLVALISENSWGVPVRDMEALLALGDDAASSIVVFLENQDLSCHAEVELLWPVVTLGELRDPRAVPVLLRLLREAPGLEVPVATAEALGKLGTHAVTALERSLDEGQDAMTRILIYAALALTGLPAAWSILEDALETDPELDFVVARALSDRNQAGDEDRLHRAYRDAAPWKRSAFEETLAGMMAGRTPWSPPFRDWRLRYRRQPRQDLKIPRSWPDVMVLLWEHRQGLRPDMKDSPRSLEELRRQAAIREEEDVCPDCGEPFRSPTGVPLCGEVEEDLITFQLERVRDWMGDRWEDIHEVLDELDHHEMEAIQWPEDTDEERTNKGEALDAIEVVKNTLCWMVEEGVTGLSQGEKRLWAALQRARSRKP